MKIRRPACFDRFTCIAGHCPDTCCAGWVIDLDEDAYARYQALPGTFGDHVRSHLTGPAGQRTIRQCGGRCAFLQQDGRCELVCTLGEEGLGQVCHLHPRFTKYYGARREDALSLSCPEAARLLLTEPDGAAFVESDSDEPVRPNSLERGRFLTALQLREAAMALAQDRSLPFSRRLDRLLALAAPMQRALRRADPDAPLPEGREGSVRGRTAPIWPRLAALEMTAPTLRELLLAADHAPPCPDDELMLERLLVYTLHRFFLDAAEDGNAAGCIQLAAVFVLAARALWRSDAAPGQTPERRAWLAHYLARELEHSEENLAALFRAFRHDRAFSIKNLRRLALA